MPIKADCSSCGHSFNAASKYAGKKVRCPKCKEPLIIPAAKTSSGKSAASKITAKCDCGKKFAAKVEWAGKKVKCPGCGNPIRIPGGKQKATASKAAQSTTAKPKPKPEPAADGSLGGLFDEVGYNLEDGSAHKKCPECRAAMADEAIICIHCGYNETRAKKWRPIARSLRKIEPKAAEKLDPGMKAMGKKKKKKSGGPDFNVSTPVIAAAVPLVMLGITAAVNAIAPEFARPVFAVSIFVTVLVSVAGFWWVRSIAAMDSFVQSLMVAMIPGYIFFYVFANWEETKDGFLLGIIPIPILIVGLIFFAPLLQIAG